MSLESNSSTYYARLVTRFVWYQQHQSLLNLKGKTSEVEQEDMFPIEEKQTKVYIYIYK